MEKKKKIKLTDDTLTNIHIMIPLLDDRAKEIISYLMYGYYLGEELASKKMYQIFGERKKDET